MRIMFFGDMAGTGFGSVTRDLGLALLNLGHDVRFVSQNELGTIAEPFNSRTFQVNDPDGWLAMKRKGIEGLLNGKLWFDGWVPEGSVILSDFYGCEEVVMASEEATAAFGAVPTLHYVPIEGVDLPPTWAELWQIIHPVAMSNFGVDQIERILGYRVPMVYHGIDTEQFAPVSSTHPLRLFAQTGDARTLRSKDECKAFFQYDGSLSWSETVKRASRTKWLFRADRNMPRKRYNSLFRALAPVLANHPDTFLVTHCGTKDYGGRFRDTWAKYPKQIRDRMLSTGFHDQAGGASRDILTALYNAADVYVSVSAEGFGLTLAEAIACGTPAVGIDYSSVPEVIGPAGILAPIWGIVDNEWDHFWAAVDERAYGPIVSSLLDDDLLRKRLGREGPEHVKRNFSWAKAAEQFAQILSERMVMAA